MKLNIQVTVLFLIIIIKHHTGLWEIHARLLVDETGTGSKCLRTG